MRGNYLLIAVEDSKKGVGNFDLTAGSNRGNLLYHFCMDTVNGKTYQDFVTPIASVQHPLIITNTKTKMKKRPVALKNMKSALRRREEVERDMPMTSRERTRHCYLLLDFELQANGRKDDLYRRPPSDTYMCERMKIIPSSSRTRLV